VLAGVARVLKPVNATKSALKAVIKNEITLTHDRFVKTGKIDVHSHNAVKDLYVEYGKLGGNGGHVEKLVNDIDKLTIER
jgi:hypothetical protein